MTKEDEEKKAESERIPKDTNENQIAQLVRATHQTLFLLHTIIVDLR